MDTKLEVRRTLQANWPRGKIAYLIFPGELAVPASALQARILTTLPGWYVSKMLISVGITAVSYSNSALGMCPVTDFKKHPILDSPTKPRPARAKARVWDKASRHKQLLIIRP